MKDLFGDEIDETISIKTKGKRNKWKTENGYRVSHNPIECCKYCKGLIRKEFHNKTYYKCKQLVCSNSTATDIRLKNVCDQFSTTLNI